MSIKTNFIKHLNKWSAFATVKGLDIQEFGQSEAEAIINLINRHKM